MKERVAGFSADGKRRRAQPKSPPPKSTPMPLYERIKTYVTDHIASGAWKPGDKVPSENELAGILGASRLTVHRAFRELTTAGLLNRLHGVGTFVAERMPFSTIVRLHNIADEIRERGDRLSVKVHKLQRVKATDELAERLAVVPKTEVFHSLIVYRANDVPVQLEDRFVSAKFAPNYVAQDFTRQSTTDYLQAIAYPTEATMMIEATMPTPECCRLLNIPWNEPCLVVTRHTKVNELVTTYTRFFHPSSRHRVVSTFDFREGGPKLVSR